MKSILYRSAVAALALSLWGPVMTPSSMTESHAASPRAAALSQQDQADIARAEAYLNSIGTLKARFLQIAPNGMQAEGTAFIARPGRMRLQYDPPSPLLVVANGRFLIFHDRELGDPSYIPLNSTPAGVLVRENVRLNGADLAVTRVVRGPGILEISLIDPKDSGQGELTLVFSEGPLTLRQWRVLDAQGQVTTVSLYEAQTGIALDPKLFQFQDPKFLDPFQGRSG